MNAFVKRFIFPFFVIFAFITALIVWCKPFLEFQLVKFYRKEGNISERYAARIKDNIQGTRLALNDFDCFGGDTRGWSSWMLLHSSLTNEVETSLRAISSDTGQNLSRRIEAMKILFLRTGDIASLKELFQLVKNADGLATKRGRELLANIVDFGDKMSQINVPNEKDIPLTLDEFSELLKTLSKVPNELNSPRQP